MLIVHQMTTMDVCDGNLMLAPKCNTKRVKLKFIFIMIMPLPDTFSPHIIFRDISSAFLYELIVCKDKKVHKSSGAGSSFSGGWNEVLQGGVMSNGRNEVLLIHSQPS